MIGKGLIGKFKNLSILAYTRRNIRKAKIFQLVEKTAKW
jgi:hypothetical protein